MNWKFAGDRIGISADHGSDPRCDPERRAAPGGKSPLRPGSGRSGAGKPQHHARALTELEREGLLVSGGTSGRSVTQDEAVLVAMREQTLEELARECAEKFMTFGVTPTQAAQLLLGLETKKEE